MSIRTHTARASNLLIYRVDPTKLDLFHDHEMPSGQVTVIDDVGNDERWVVVGDEHADPVAPIDLGCHVAPMPSSPPFVLDEAAAERWATGLTNDDGEVVITPGWDPRWDEEGTVAYLLNAAQDQHVLNGPPLTEVVFEEIEDGNGCHYRFLVCLGENADLILASWLENTPNLADDAVGAGEAALAATTATALPADAGGAG